MRCKACNNQTAHPDYELCAMCYHISERVLRGTTSQYLGVVKHSVTPGSPQLEKDGKVLAYGCSRTYSPVELDRDYDL